MLEYRVSVHRGNDRIGDKVLAVGKEVQCDHIARSGAVRRS